MDHNFVSGHEYSNISKYFRTFKGSTDSNFRCITSINERYEMLHVQQLDYAECLYISDGACFMCCEMFTNCVA